jgi:hypothetical protein
VVTTAEELGLAGGRALAASDAAPRVALNVDTVDDRGRFVCMTHGGRSRALAAALRAAGEGCGVPVRTRRLVPGILTDSVALADAGWAAVTLSRGDARTLARIHTPGDAVGRVSGAGAADAARLLAAAASSIR